MTKTLKFAIGAAAALVLVAGTGGAVMAARGQGPMGPGGFAGRRGPGGPGGPGGPMGVLPGLRALNLTETQREQVRATMESHKAEFEQQRDRQRTAHQALQAAVTSPSFDEAAVRQKAADVAAVEADGAVLHAKVYSEVWALLTPEQQQKAGELKAQAGQRAERRRGRIEQRRERRPQH